ncbi:MAG: hypothetical protein PVJ09_01965 [Candidatus Woesebacteria bacterium]|jgi:purine nucleoside phosphorylase
MALPDLLQNTPFHELARQEAYKTMSVEFILAKAAYEQALFYQHLVESKEYIQEILKELEIASLDGWIVCGSGLASLSQSSDIEILHSISVTSIPHWFCPQVEGHGQALAIADIAGQKVAIQTGRAHIYDTDYSPQQLKIITAPLIVAKSLGVNWLISTNAAGVYDNGKVQVGDVLVDVDYVNQHGVNPFIGANDERLGPRFTGKANLADPYLFAILGKLVPAERLHLAIYTLASNAPFFEGAADIAKGLYPMLLEQNPELAQAFGMSFAMEAMVMGHFNNPPQDPQGFDRPVRWMGLTAATNIIPPISAITKEQLLAGAVANPNPTSHKEVLEAGGLAEKLLIPAVIKLCAAISKEALPAIS